MPEGANWLQLYAVAVLCGIGFTMSLFIGTLAFEHVGADRLQAVKLGVVIGSLICAVLGAVLLKLSTRVSPAAPRQASASREKMPSPRPLPHSGTYARSRPQFPRKPPRAPVPVPAAPASYTR